MLNRLYGSIAKQRRRWYTWEGESQRRLQQPVISVGALAVGGSGKTPVAAYVATILNEIGERPSILSRGYGRERRLDGVVVVSDRQGVRSGFAEAGDEPMMLARALTGIRVLVSEDRYLAGRLAETKLEASVHVLDDGYQHFFLHRDVELLLLSERDVTDARTLPGGYLREPLETACYADALIMETADLDEAQHFANRFGVERAFHFMRVLKTPFDAETKEEVAIDMASPVLAVAGIALPEIFFAGLGQEGYKVTETLTFPDHHSLTNRDISEIGRLANVHNVEYVVTTEKDLVRFLPHAPFDFRLVAVPLAVSIEPASLFRTWLCERIQEARETAR